MNFYARAKDWFAARSARFAPTESLAPLAAAALVLGSFAYDAFFDVEGGAILCPLRRATGIPCPSCGLTRAFVSLAHGRFGHAWEAHPLGWVLWSALALTVGAWVVRVVLNRPPRVSALVARAWSGLLVAFVLVWLARL